MWKQKIYAFILRRALGPMLTPSSRAQLSDDACMQVSMNLQEGGRFVFCHVELDPDYLNDKVMRQLVSKGDCDCDKEKEKELVILKVSVEMLVVTLTLGGSSSGTKADATQEEQEGDASDYYYSETNGYLHDVPPSHHQPQHPTATPAATQGNNLVQAQVQLQGVRIHMAPRTRRVSTSHDAATTPTRAFSTEAQNTSPTTASSSSPSNTTNATTTTSSTNTSTTLNSTTTPPPSTNTGGISSFFSSYVDAALSSLKVQLDDVQLRLYLDDHHHHQQEIHEEGQWIAIGLKSASYSDLASSNTTHSTNANNNSFLHTLDANKSNNNNDKDAVHGGQSQNQKHAVLEQVPLMDKLISFSGLYITASSSSSSKPLHGHASTTASPSMPSPSNTIHPHVSTTPTHHHDAQPTTNTTTTLLQTQGNGTIRIRILQRTFAPPSSSTTTISPNTEDDTRTVLLHDMDVHLQQRWSFTLIPHSCFLLKRALDSVQACLARSNSAPSRRKRSGLDAEQDQGQCDTDGNDIHDASATQAWHSLQQRYNTARQLAEEKQMVGGLLLPSTTTTSTMPSQTPTQTQSHPALHDMLRPAKDVCESTTSYDAFFDCHDRSFSTYLSLVRPVEAEEERYLDTKVKFHLAEIEVALYATNDNGVSANGGGGGGVMLQWTIADVDSSLSMSTLETKLHLDISHFAMDMLEQQSPRQTTQSHSMLRFVEEIHEDEHGLGLGDIGGGGGGGGGGTYLVTSPPCISFAFRQSNLVRRGQEMEWLHGGGGKKDGVPPVAVERTVEVHLLPLEVMWRKEVMEVLGGYSLIMAEDEEEEEKDNEDDETNEVEEEWVVDETSNTTTMVHTKTSLICSSPKLTLLVPVPLLYHDHDNYTRSAVDTLLARGYNLTHHESYAADQPVMALQLQNWSVEAATEEIPPAATKDDVDGDGAMRTTKIPSEVDNGVKVTLESAHVFVAYGEKRFDVISVKGQGRSTMGGMDGSILGSNTTSNFSPVVVRYTSHDQDPSTVNPSNPLQPIEEHSLFPQVCTPKTFVKSVHGTSTKSMKKHGRGLQAPSKEDLVQTEMMEQAQRCTSTVQVTIPCLDVDVTLQERDALVYLMQDLIQAHQPSTQESSHEEQQQQRQRSQASSLKQARSRMAVACSVQQTTLILRESAPPLDSTMGNHQQDDVASFILVLEEVQSHAVLVQGGAGRGGMQQVRVLVHDVCLYEGIHNGRPRSAALPHARPTPSPSQHNVHTPRNRLLQAPFDVAHPIVHRSKLGTCSSPQTPSILLDLVLFSEDEDEDDVADVGPGGDVEVYLSLYDVTFRYRYESTWVERLSSMLVTRNEQEVRGLDNHDEEEKKEENVETLEDEAVDLTKIFLTMRDCNLDYTSPSDCRRATRAILGLGHVHVSSNLVSNAPVQAYKLHLSNATVDLAHGRVSYKEENARLTRYAQILSLEDGGKMQGPQGCLHMATREEVLQRMEFVTVASVDSLDSFITVQSLSCSNEGEEERVVCTTAGVTADVTVGHVSLYVCRDSFSCLTDAIGELVLKMTALTEEQIAEAKAASALALASTSPPATEMAKLQGDADDHAVGEGVSVCFEEAADEISSHASLASAEADMVAPLPSEASPSSPKVKEHMLASNNHEKEMVSILDVIEENMFANTNPNTEASNDGTNPQLQSNGTTSSSVSGANEPLGTKNPFENVPDSELSASELRRKHGVVDMDDVAVNLAKSLLIKNYYTIDTTSTSSPLSQQISSKDADRVDNKHRNGVSSLTPASPMSEGGCTGKQNRLLPDSCDWTTVDHAWPRDVDITSGDVHAEQSSTWYNHNESGATMASSAGHGSKSEGTSSTAPTIQIFPQHVPLAPARDPLADGDMNAAKLAGLKDPPRVALRVLVRDASATCRFFDGYDWPKASSSSSSANSSASRGARTNGRSSKGRRQDLLNGLLDGEEEGGGLFSSDSSSNPAVGMNGAPSSPKLFSSEDVYYVDHPPPSSSKKTKKTRQRRQVDRYFECCLSGVQLRLDAFQAVPEIHRLASCLDVKVMDFFLSETVSERDGVEKMLGEWVHDYFHPRDTDDGMIMMKMVSTRPECMFSADGKLMSDRSRVTLELLPLRCHIDQVALVFLRSFFSGDDDNNMELDDEENMSDVSEDGSLSCAPLPHDAEMIAEVGTFFDSFRVKPCKLKVNYRPVGVNAAALRDGCYVELLNLFSLEDMELTLQTVDMSDLTGWGEVFAELARRWIEDICATQMHKFLTGATPFHSVSNLSGGMADLVLIPVRHFKTEGKLVKGVRRATSSFAGTVALEALNHTSKLTGKMAKALAAGGTQALALSSSSKSSSKTRDKGVSKSKKNGNITLPSRPATVPRGVTDTASHAYESISSSLRVTNYAIVVVPRREYRKHGPSGAIKSVVRAIPVAVLAPLSGASEALSYTLLGFRNQLRPDIRKEEEARRRGLLR